LVIWYRKIKAFFLKIGGRESQGITIPKEIMK
jgi:hypothetical protein